MKVIIAAWKFSVKERLQSYYIAKKLYDCNKLHKIICRETDRPKRLDKAVIEIEPDLIEQPGVVIEMANKFINKSRLLLQRSAIRYYQEKLFDKYVSSQLDNKCDILFYDISSGLDSLNKAKKCGLLTMVQEQMAHPKFNHTIIEEECKKFNVAYNTALMHPDMLKRRTSVLKECELIIALSSSVAKKSLESHGIPSCKIQVVPLGVDSNHFKPQKRVDDKFRVLFVGNGTLIKGVPYLLDAWKRLSLKNAELIICGVQNRKILARYKKDVDFKAPGFVEAINYYKKASIFVLPSLSDAFSRAVLEAMACGLPVIISDGVGAMDIITNGEEGFVVPVKDVNALSERINYLYCNQEQIVDMGRNARKTAKKYTWERYGASIVDVIEKSIN